MLQIEQKLENGKMLLQLIGRVDTTTAPRLEEIIVDCEKDISEMIMDMAQLEYISSAGLRVILKAQKMMNRQGKLVLRNVNEAIEEVFEITGFIDILTIE